MVQAANLEDKCVEVLNPAFHKEVIETIIKYDAGQDYLLTTMEALSEAIISMYHCYVNLSEKSKTQSELIYHIEAIKEHRDFVMELFSATTGKTFHYSKDVG